MNSPVNKNVRKFIPKSLKGLLNLFYRKLFRINDTPHKIALGMGIGVFSGILPGTGPIAALFLALILRANRAAALLGSLLTNTWLSIVTFLLAIRAGSAIMRVDWQVIRDNWWVFLRDFHWGNLLKLSILKVILPVIVGYLAVAICLGLAIYLITLILVIQTKYAIKGRVNFSR